MSEEQQPPAKDPIPVEVNPDTLKRLLSRRLADTAGAHAIRRLKEVESEGLITEENILRYLKLHTSLYDIAHLFTAIQYRDRLICVVVLGVTGELTHKDCNLLVDPPDRDVISLATEVINEMLYPEQS